MDRDFFLLIKDMSPDMSVLDIGYGGLDGENTTEYLLRKFNHNNMVGLVKENRDSRRYADSHRDIRVLWGAFPDIMPDTKFDLIVADLNIDTNIKHNWTDKGLDMLLKYLDDGGYLINYVMKTTDYGDEATTQLITNHWKEWWGSETFSDVAIVKKLLGLKNFELIDILQEPRRSYITWVKLKKISG